MTILFNEGFEDSNLTSRGWYDSTNGVISTTEHIPGSIGSLECRFLQNATTPIGFTSMRHLFSPSDEVHLSYWIKHSNSWIGSGKPYHPHILYFLTNLNVTYSGLAYTYLTSYIEENQGFPQICIQDGENIDETKIGTNLIGITENRATAGCNGTQPNIGQSDVDCYLSGTVHWNGTVWKCTTPYFFDATEKVKWHHIEAYFKLNSIYNNIGQPDGILKYYYDNNLEIYHDNVIIRTGKNPTMQFNQFIIAPYIGDGSPSDQTLWIDDLTVSVPDTTCPQIIANFTMT